MIKKLFRSQQAKEKIERWRLSQDNFAKFLFYLLILFLPTQLGKHFWPQFSFIQGLRLDYLSPTIYLTDVFIVLIILFSFSKIIKFFKGQNKNNVFLILLFFITLLLGILNAKNPEAGFYAVLKIIEYLLFGICAALIFKKLNIKYFIYALVLGIIFESSLSFLQVYENGSINGIFYFFGERYFTAQAPGIANASISGQLFLRPYATFSHPNVLAGYLIFAMAFLYLFKQYVSKKIFISIILIGSITLFSTLSRIAILFWSTFLLFTFCLSLFEKYKNRVSAKNTLIILSVIVLSTILIFSVSKNIAFVQRFSQTSFSEESFVQRKDLMYQAINMFIKNPVVGVGVNNFYNNLEKTKGKTLLIQPVHNIFLLTLSQAGLVGFAYFIFIFYKYVKISFSKNRNKNELLLIFMLIALGMVDHYFLTIQQGQIIFVLIFSYIFSAKIK